MKPLLIRHTLQDYQGQLKDHQVYRFTMTPSSFLGLEGLHVFITGAAGDIGRRAVQEFLGMLLTYSVFASWRQVPSMY